MNLKVLSGALLPDPKFGVFQQAKGRGHANFSQGRASGPPFSDAALTPSFTSLMYAFLSREPVKHHLIR